MRLSESMQSFKEEYTELLYNDIPVYNLILKSDILEHEVLYLFKTLSLINRREESFCINRFYRIRNMIKDIPRYCVYNYGFFVLWTVLNWAEFDFTLDNEPGDGFVEYDPSKPDLKYFLDQQEFIYAKYYDFLYEFLCDDGKNIELWKLLYK